MGATRSLSEFAVRTTFDRLPTEVVRESKRCILNYLGVALGAADHQAVRLLMETIAEEGGKRQATVLGHGRRCSAIQAATINGTMSHVLDYDDTHLPTVIHPTGPVLSAALATAEWKGLSGRELIAALATGMEVELRVGSAVYPAHYDVGWHITGTAGTFGAAAAVGKLLQLSEEQMTHALGMAGAQAAGLREMFGSMTKALHVGKAASNGLLSAMLATRGFTASTEVLEGRRGFCAVTASEYDLGQITVGLGDEYLMLQNGIKPYACGVVTHPTIDGVRRLRERYRLAPNDVLEIETKIHPLVRELTGKKSPRTGLEGKFSIYFCAAIALIEGNARESQFTDEKVNRPDVIALMDRVRAQVEPGVLEDQAVVSIRTVDGRILVERVEAATGTPNNPMPDDQLMEKYLELSTRILPRDRAEQLAEQVAHMEKMEDPSGILEAATLRRRTGAK
ncbi:MAG TPA: MmgE/PrpD family protein [Chloroflexota bacterium]|nr:MmgE/PrpD family protein [Chloroflexota bacterium]